MPQGLPILHTPRRFTAMIGTAFKTLRVTGPNFVAAVIWTHDPIRGGWRCLRAAPILKYLASMSPEQAEDYCEKRGWKCEWVKKKDRPSQRR